MRSPRPITIPRRSRGKARAVLAAERTQSVAGLGCRTDTGCISPARCRAAERCLSAGAAITSDEEGVQ